MDPTNALNAPETPTGTSPATTVHHPLVATSSERCPSCGDTVASDQRYCLHCGQRCGEPRLPFMNAVTFMDAMKRPAATEPPPPKPKRRGLSPNAVLITGVATLLLAMGVGVLIGRSGNHSVATNASQPAQVITVNGGGGAETAGGTGSAGGVAGASGSKSSKGSKKAAKQAKVAAESGKGAEEVLKPAGDVKLPPATVQPGEKCESGAAGCKGGKFTGSFFGE
jgi:hypothetical protein